MKRTWVLSLLVFSHASHAALASIPLSESAVEPRGDFRARRAQYVKQEGERLDQWDKEAARIKARSPSQRYQAADDLQLQIKDLRGDLLKLKSASPEIFGKDRVRYEAGLRSTESALRQLH